MSLIGGTPVEDVLDLGFVRRNGKTILERRMHRYPFAVSRLFHLDTVPSGMASVILQTVSGTLNAGDRLSGRLHAAAGSAAHVRTQGATVVHRAPEGLEVSECFDLCAADGSLLEYLPEPRVLFPDSCLSQRTHLVLGTGAVAIMCDGFLVHDPGQAGRGFRRYETSSRITSSDGKLLAMERVCLDAMPVASGRRSGYRAFGTLTVATRNEPAHLEALCGAITSGMAGIEGLYWSVSTLPNGSGATLRLAARDGRAMRVGIESGWIASRRDLFGRAPGLRASWL